MRRLVGLCCAASLVSGCAELNSIYRKGALSPATGGVVTIDAKQRNLLFVPETDAGKVTKWRMCAEAAPDVFSALSSSLGAEAALGGTSKQARLAVAMAESAATIERTQTVNLLRESLYRTCERYLSGGLDSTQFIIQAARDQKSMVAVLAVEQLTGAIKAQSTIISGPATSASVVNAVQAAELIKLYTEDWKKLKTDAEVADAAFKAADAKGQCKDKETRPDDVDEGAWADCLAKKAENKAKDGLAADAKQRLDKIIDLGGGFGSKESASTSTGTSSAGTPVSGRPGDAALMAVAEAVSQITLQTGIDESLMFCVSYLSTTPVIKTVVTTFPATPTQAQTTSTTTSQRDDDLKSQCLQILQYRALRDEELRAQQLLSGISPIRLMKIKLSASKADQFFSDLLSKVGRSSVAALPNIQTIEDAGGTKLGLAAKCTDVQACLVEIDDNKIALVLAFRDHEVAMIAALNSLKTS